MLTRYHFCSRLYRQLMRRTRSWGLQLVRKNSTWLARERGWQKKQCCGEPSRGCKISNALGSSWCSVRVRGATISCAPCLPAFQHRTRKAMIEGCKRLWPLCWKVSRGTRANRELQASWRHCPCEWEDWVLVQRRGLPRQHTGLHGATHFT